MAVSLETIQAIGEFNSQHMRYLHLIQDKYNPNVIAAQLNNVDPAVEILNGFLAKGVILPTVTGSLPTGEATAMWGGIKVQNTTVYKAQDTDEYDLLGYFGDHGSPESFYGDKVMKIGEKFALADTVGRLAVNISYFGLDAYYAIDTSQGLADHDEQRLKKQRRIYGSIPLGKTRVMPGWL